MGPYLSVPKKEKNSEDGENSKVTLTFIQIDVNYDVIDEIWSVWNARMEKHYGRHSYCSFGSCTRRVILWGLRWSWW